MNIHLKAVFFSEAPNGKHPRNVNRNMANFKRKKQLIVEQLRNKRAKCQIIEDENESLGPTNHMSRAAKTKFIAAASTLDPDWLLGVQDLSREQFYHKTLLLSLQNNGEYNKYTIQAQPSCDEAQNRSGVF